MLNKLKNFFTIEKRTEYFVHIIIYLFLASVVIFTLLIIGGKSLSRNENSTAKTEISPFKDLTFEGKGIVVFDVINNREIFSKNPDEPLPLASLTKVLTAVITNEKLNDNQEVKIAKEYLEPEGDSQLVVGDTWKIKDLRDFTLLTSSNDGALALAAVTEINNGQTTNDFSSKSLEAQFVKEMNDVASKIGLPSCKFFNGHGLDRSGEESGAYGSARDMATLFGYVLKNYPEILEATRYKNLEFASSEKTYSAKNTNVFVDKIPNLIASKTGYTDLAGGNLVIAFDAGLNRPIVISILGSTSEGRFDDALKLVEATLKDIPNL